MLAGGWEPRRSQPRLRIPRFPRSSVRLGAELWFWIRKESLEWRDSRHALRRKRTYRNAVHAGCDVYVQHNLCDRSLNAVPFSIKLSNLIADNISQRTHLQDVGVQARRAWVHRTQGNHTILHRVRECRVSGYSGLNSGSRFEVWRRYLRFTFYLGFMGFRYKLLSVP